MKEWICMIAGIVGGFITTLLGGCCLTRKMQKSDKQSAKLLTRKMQKRPFKE